MNGSVMDVTDAFNQFFSSHGVIDTMVKPSHVRELLQNVRSSQAVDIMELKESIVDLSLFRPANHPNPVFIVWLTLDHFGSINTHKIVEVSYTNMGVWEVSYVSVRNLDEFLGQYKRERKMEGRRGLMDI